MNEGVRETEEERAGPPCPGCGGRGPRDLPCGHRLCPPCLELCERELGETACTVCYGRDVLGGLVEGLLESLFQGQPRRDAPRPGRGREVCPLHGERLTLFCLQDEEPVCPLCRAAGHQEHRCASTEEAAQDYKRELRTVLKALEEKLEARNTAKQTCDEMAEHIKSQSLQTERLAKEEFEKLHQFLRDEEAALVAALKEEEEEKSQKIRERIEKMAGEIASLSDAIKMVEEELEAEDLALLQNFKTTVERARCTQQESEKAAGTLIDVARHLGSLKHRVWEKMQEVTQYTPVVLDPNTADVCLVVSDDLTAVRYTEDDQRLPDNAERFGYYECVLGAEGLGSGRHAWDVEVGESTEWALGVAEGTVPRKEWFPMSPETGLWSIGLYAGEYRARAPVCPPIAVKRTPRRVRVQLDWDRGRLTFSDPSDNALLYRFQHRFTDKVYPYVSNTSKHHPLRILPGRVSVIAE
ncbi:E3 ubiquitin-protein ligase TRIM35-like isoform X2 [Conger conger]|uniref:E3 ubiquitin-protein ligase TRIM35-like isoform X2 n=1 Tax=Conger conger TaxID=82655 RepID=UPI002A5AEFBF|nr:E3 ubiquitin-protein ligase TRIM35-like isoform X2 [Conger conger]